MLWPYLLVRIRKSPWHISTLKNPTPLFRETIKFRTFCESRNNWGIFVNIVADVLFYVSISRGRYSSMFTKIGARYTGAHSREILSTSTTKYLNSKFFKGGKASRIVPAPLDIIRRHCFSRPERQVVFSLSRVQHQWLRLAEPHAKLSSPLVGVYGEKLSGESSLALACHARSWNVHALLTLARSHDISSRTC